MAPTGFKTFYCYLRKHLYATSLRMAWIGTLNSNDSFKRKQYMLHVTSNKVRWGWDNILDVLDEPWKLFFPSYLQISFIERYLNTAFSNQRKTFSGSEEVFYVQKEDGDAPIFKSIHATYTSYLRSWVFKIWPGLFKRWIALSTG